MAKKIMVKWNDNCGLPRAWATGPADKREEVRAAAKDQLEAYKQGKPDASCVAELEPFTEEIVELEGTMATADNEFHTAIHAAISTRRPELLRSFIDEVCAGNVLTSRQQRALLGVVCDLVEQLAKRDEDAREFVHVVEGIRHAQKQAEAAHDKARAFLTRLQGGPDGS